MFGRMMVQPMVQVDPGVDLQIAVAALMKAAETVELVRWIELPASVLLFLLVRGDKDSRTRTRRVSRLPQLLSIFRHGFRVNIATYEQTPGSKWRRILRYGGTVPSFSLPGADQRRRSGRIPEARASYEKALARAQQERGRSFLARRLQELK